MFAEQPGMRPWQESFAKAVKQPLLDPDYLAEFQFRVELHGVFLDCWIQRDNSTRDMVKVVKVDIPDRIKQNHVIATGLSSWVLRVDAVAKCFTRPTERDREIAVYERLGCHRSILKYYGSLDGSILLQIAPHGTIQQYLQSSHEPPLAMRLRWAEQATEVIAYLHSKGVFHCDISYANIFLDADCNAMVGDFAGSSIEDEESLGWYGTSHHHPDIDDPSAETEIFALGSTFCEILTGKNPFDGYQGVEIEKAIRNGDFPNLEHLPALRIVISKCWKGSYNTVDELLLEVKQESGHVQAEHSLVNRQVYIGLWPAIGLALTIALPVTWWIRSLRLLSRN